MTTTPSTITAAQANVPAALNPFLRDPERAIRYRWWTRWFDHRAGTADARRTRTSSPRPATSDDTVLSTPWLARLFYERDTAIRAEQRTTAALTSVLDAQITTAQTHLETLSEQLNGASERLEAVKHMDPADRTPTVSERAYSTAAETSTRSANLHAATLAAAEAELSRLHAGIRADQIHIAERSRDIASHRHILAIRSLHLTAWYQRRAATYARAHAHVTGTRALTPEPEPPAPLPAPKADAPR